MRQLLLVVGIFAIALPLSAQAPQGRAGGAGRGGRGDNPLGGVGALGQEVKRPPVNNAPAPRLPDGTVSLDGLWVGAGPVNDIAQGLPKGETLPLLPASVKLMEYRAQHETDDPHLWCMPMGVPRSTPYPFRFVQDIAAKDVPFIPSWVGQNTAVYGQGMSGVEDTLDPSFIFRFWLVTKAG